MSHTTQRPSLVQIARAAGVSPATVSRAFNRPALLSARTRDHILHTAGELGYRPDRIGSSLRSGSTKTLGLLLPTLENPVFAACFEGAEARAREAGYSVMLSTTGYNAERETAAARDLLDHRVEGLILTVGDPATSATLAELQASDAPFVLAYNESEAHPFVSVDNHAAAGDMIAHLAGLGHRRMALITGPLEASDRALHRLEGARQRADALGLPVPEHLAMARHTAVDHERLGHLLARPAAPTALFCSNDLLAAAVIAALAEQGLSVPEDLSVCGFDGMAFGGLMVPALASVYQPSHDIGRQACHALLQRLEGHHVTGERLAHRLIPGGTVAPVIPAVLS
ncbi:LacI family DNA-binding transcriptional regulator [Kushneria sp. EE4]